MFFFFHWSNSKKNLIFFFFCRETMWWMKEECVRPSARWELIAAHLSSQNVGNSHTFHSDPISLSDGAVHFSPRVDSTLSQERHRRQAVEQQSWVITKNYRWIHSTFFVLLLLLLLHCVHSPIKMILLICLCLAVVLSITGLFCVTYSPHMFTYITSHSWMRHFLPSPCSCVNMPQPLMAVEGLEA